MRRLVLLLLLVVAMTGSAAATVSVSADDVHQQQADNSTEPESVVASVDSQTRIADYWYNATTETMHIEVSNVGERHPSEVTATEVVNTEDGGSSTFGIERFTVSPGETIVVEVSSERISGKAGVMVTTEESVESGEGTLIVEDREQSILNGGATWSDVRAAGFFALAAAMLWVIIGAWYYLSQSHQGASEVGLDPDQPTIGGGGSDE